MTHCIYIAPKKSSYLFHLQQRCERQKIDLLKNILMQAEEKTDFFTKSKRNNFNEIVPKSFPFSENLCN